MNTFIPLNAEQGQVAQLYHDWIKEWNQRNAMGMANLVTDYGTIIGFDGSQLNGRIDIQHTLGQIFTDHQTASYVTLIIDSLPLADTVMLLRAHVSMLAPEKNDINPALNAIQSLVAIKQQGNWAIALFQNTPAQFHGRPDEIEKFSNELRKAL